MVNSEVPTRQVTPCGFSGDVNTSLMLESFCTIGQKKAISFAPVFLWSLKDSFGEIPLAFRVFLICEIKSKAVFPSSRMAALIEVPAFGHDPMMMQSFSLRSFN